MTVHEHIKELRGRLFGVAAVFLVASCLAYVYRAQVLSVLLMPLHGQKLSYLTVGGGFGFIFSITMWCGAMVALPFLLYSLYQFISPALPKRAQTSAPIVLFVSFVLLCCGVVFGYYCAIPGAIKFLTEFVAGDVQSVLTTDSYMSFVIAYTLGLGALFQVPLILVIAHWITPLKPKKLLSFERYVIVVSFILAAVITPTPDIVNQALIALPVIAMYQLGVIAVLILSARERARRKKMPSVQTRHHSKPVHAPKPVQARASKPPVIASPTVTVRPQKTLTKQPYKTHRAIDGISTMITKPQASRQAIRVPTRPVGGIYYQSRAKG